MTPVLDDLLNDGRLLRLFSKDARHCALQLWVLQVKFEESTENRIIYGRLLPYSHSNDRWSFSHNDNFHTFGQLKAKVTRLNLYVTSIHCAELLRQLSAGRTISEISEELKFEIPAKLKTQFGDTALAPNGLAYRPVALLLNRDAFERRSPSSPHGEAGAFSASITQIGKRELLRTGSDFNITLTESVIKHLKAETGLDFGGVDISRFGDIELLVFPTLDDKERLLLDVSWTDAPRALVARLDPLQLPNFSAFLFRLSIANDGQIIFSGFATAERDEKGVFECKFDLGEQLRAKTDSTELEIFGIHGDHSREGTLCCRWGVAYFRELLLRGHVTSHKSSPIKFDWLEKVTRPSASERVKAALTINRSDLHLTNRSNGRVADPWVPANRDLVSLFARLYPPKSEGLFFQNLGEGRLQFVEWFKKLLTKYGEHQVVIFDPYFEDAGLGLLLLSAASEADYIVFTSLPKPKGADAEPSGGDKPDASRLNNLVACCEQNNQLIRRIKLRIYGLKEGRLHDRYILIMGHDGFPTAGFNLSNSFQKAAENYPLLVTPIPSDVLLKVEKYKSDLVKEAQKSMTALNEELTVHPPIRKIFDSTETLAVQRRYEPLRLLEKANAGDVLGVWTGKSALQGLSGDRLKDRVVELNLFQNGSFVLLETTGLSNCLAKQGGHFADFTSTWEVLGEVLAHSRAGTNRFHELEAERGFLEFLERFLAESFNRVHDDGDKELVVIDTELFREPIDILLQSSYHPDHLFHASKYTALTWPEYFTIRFLWWYSPNALLEIAEGQISKIPTEPQSDHSVRLSLLSQIVSEISLSMQIDISEEQRQLLVRSKNGLFHWMGLCAINQKLDEPGGLTVVRQLVASFPHPTRVRALGWMVRHAAASSEKAEIYNGLVATLHEAAPPTISAEELRDMVDSMRGHMRELAWAEPWLFRDVVFPLLQIERANTDDACEIWVQELTDLLNPERQRRPFDRAREGQTTNISAFLFACSSLERQQVCLKSMQAILKKQRAILQQPLASTSNWARWDDALVVSMWILTFTRWSQYYQHERGMNLRGRDVTNSELESLSRSARELALVRPMVKWRNEGAGTQTELAAFLDQVETLLVSRDDSDSKSET